MDIGFVDGPSTGKNSKCDWTQVLVPGELKSNPSADSATCLASPADGAEAVFAGS